MAAHRAWNFAEGASAYAQDLDRAPRGIRGWLILPAIGLVLGAILGVLSLIGVVAFFPEGTEPGYRASWAAQILVQAGLLVLLLYAAVRFFGKRQNAPATMITLMIVSVVASGALLLIALGAEAEEIALANGKSLVGSIIGSAIWIPYFMVSTRVKATFIN